MAQKIEWEIVDQPQSQDGDSHYHHRSQGTTYQSARPSTLNFMRALLGRWWQMKLLAAGVAAVMVLALLMMIGGILVLAVSAAAVVSLCVAKLASWLRNKQLGNKTQLSTESRNRWTP